MQRHRFPAPVGTRWISRCDIPDLELFPLRYPTAQSIRFHAGFASAMGQWVVWGLAQLMRVGLMSSAASFAAPLNRIAQWMEPMGTDKGGMYVALDCINHEGRPLRVTWNPIARQNYGPYIPCGAAIALAQKLARGDRLPIGAMPCMGLLNLDDYLEPLRDLQIHIEHCCSE